MVWRHNNTRDEWEWLCKLVLTDSRVGTKPFIFMVSDFEQGSRAMDKTTTRAARREGTVATEQVVGRGTTVAMRLAATFWLEASGRGGGSVSLIFG